MKKQKIKKGDMFRWSFTDKYVSEHQDDLNAGTLYWSIDRNAVALEIDGKIELVETGKYDKSQRCCSKENCKHDIFSKENLRGAEGRYGKTVNPEDVDLEYLGNQKDFHKTTKQNYMLYSQSDKLFLPVNKGYTPLYLVKKDGKESFEFQIEQLKKEINELEDTVRIALDDIEYKKNLILQYNEKLKK